jgi:hypothetical protein
MAVVFKAEIMLFESILQIETSLQAVTLYSISEAKVVGWNHRYPTGGSR